MHPAGSVILFTVASGLGFGMLTWLGLGLPDARGWAAFFHYAVAFALAGGGAFGLDLPFGKSTAVLEGLLAMAQQLVEP
jgi:hypothetical protein